MTSEIRSNTIKNRAGLGTVTFSNTGAVLSGIVTASDDFRTNEIKSQAGLGTITVSNTGTVVAGILTATKFVGDGTGLTGNLSYSGNYLGMTDTPSSYTAGAFHRSNNAGNAMQNSATLFEDSNGDIGIGVNNPSSKLHVKQSTGDVHITIESAGNNKPFKVGALGGASSGFFIENGTTNNNIFTSNSTDYVTVYGGGSARLETTNTGVTVSGVLDATGDIQISDKIIHAGDTNTAIRFPLSDTITFETAGTERLRVDSSGNATFAGNITALDGTFTGDVSIGGTLTYEDVTNIDSIGIITARSDIKVGTAVTITSAGAGFYAGIITATNFVKADGSAVGDFTTDSNNNLIAGVGAGSSIGSEEVHNIFLGFNAGAKIDHNPSYSDTGKYNVIIGSNAAFEDTLPRYNTIIGHEAKKNGNGGYEVTAVGKEALRDCTGNFNTALGAQAGRSNTNAEHSVFVGYQAASGSNGDDTIAIGSQTLGSLSSGDDNIAIGRQSGWNISTGHGNINIGRETGGSSGSYNICIGTRASHTGNPSNECLIGGNPNQNWRIDHFRIPGIGVSFSAGGAVISGIVTATNFAKADGSSIGSLDASVGSYNVIGGGSAGAQLTSSANRNTLIGSEAGSVITSGEKNTFTGAFAGQFQSTSERNTAFGAEALAQNSGNANTAVGYQALAGESERLSMIQNTAVGQGALRKLDEADYNTAIGAMSLYNCVTGNSNVAIGYNSLYTNNSGYDNVAIGCSSGRLIDSGYENVLMGKNAGEDISSGRYMVCLGSEAGTNITTAWKNVAIGWKAGHSLLAGDSNVLIGAEAGSSITNPNDNVCIGRESGSNISIGLNNIVIGTQATASANNVQNEITLGNTSITKFRIPGINFILKDNGGTPTQGHVLTVDGSGEASFAAASGGGGVSSDAQYNTKAGSNSGDAFSGTSAEKNTLFGYDTGTEINSGDDNTCIGYRSGESITSGGSNTLVGSITGERITTTSSNTALGYYCLAETTGSSNTAVGAWALKDSSNCTGNSALGMWALYANNSGNYNVAMGMNAAYGVWSSPRDYVIGIGYEALKWSKGDHNIGIGYRAGYAGDSSAYNEGSHNITIGHYSGKQLSTGSDNTIIGPDAGDALASGSNNLILGHDAAASSNSVSNEITLGDSSITKFRIPGLSASVSATESVLPAANFNAGVLQEVYINDTGGGVQSNYNHDVLSYGMVWYGVTNAVGAWTFNIRGNASTTFDSLTTTNRVTTMTMYSANNSTSNYMTAFKIDGATQTVKWAGGSAPSAATGSGVDVYSMTIMKTGSNTYHVFGNLSNFA